MKWMKLARREELEGKSEESIMLGESDRLEVLET